MKINQESNSVSALLSSRMSPCASQSLPSYAINTPYGKFPPAVLVYGLFVSKYNTSAFVCSKCRRMASLWRIDGVFSDMRIEKQGNKVQRELDLCLISIVWLL